MHEQQKLAGLLWLRRYLPKDRPQLLHLINVLEGAAGAAPRHARHHHHQLVGVGRQHCRELEMKQMTSSKHVLKQLANEPSQPPARRGGPPALHRHLDGRHALQWRWECS